MQKVLPKQVYTRDNITKEITKEKQKKDSSMEELRAKNNTLIKMGLTQ